MVRDVEPAAPMSAERRGLIYALDKIGRKEASCIIVSDLGRLQPLGRRSRRDHRAARAQ